QGGRMAFVVTRIGVVAGTFGIQGEIGSAEGGPGGARPSADVGMRVNSVAAFKRLASFDPAGIESGTIARQRRFIGPAITVAVKTARGWNRVRWSISRIGSSSFVAEQP